MKRIKVLIIDDSAFMRKLISDFLSEDTGIEVIGTARNGADGVAKVMALKPDVVTLDIEMPIMDGLKALKQIMHVQPLPVIMLSSTTKDGADNTIFAMKNGAFDFIAKPSGPISLDLEKIKEELIEKVKFASGANINELLNSPNSDKKAIKAQLGYSKIELGINNQSDEAVQFRTNHSPSLICIGTSTGGPRALTKVLSELPKTINAVILIVQHMPPGFTKSLANRLDQLSNISVKEAENGEVLHKGTAYIAPGGYHLTVKQSLQTLKANLSQMPPRNGHRPSVDILFDSVSEIVSYPKIAVIMTGMGSDGAEGLTLMKKRGTVIAIAESKDTAIVYGMPKAAVATNHIDEVKSINEIAETIMKYV
ncbi:protein-glutamate methylesterase/protein-glutamine glutaminase [Cytobacillus purgationiresistens]|uniref:Protein-glutamate methylesterase/protein-glutamine glutaminase n=1 Tax=Cytobacillus purgationiresistens TaxID=863449 RepID=A0ABU0AG27_9BACI|nr:chemotaxis response regulator protein-glutamate methylesterase [Cytobacillus purgationiresistens]MDQ0270209.1 two-component system chemotaxis response regulator CheB [Cytobacillus purgationiresistens]